MHPPLGVPERQLACSELIAALDECHNRGMLSRWTGACNKQKDALNVCLRQERIDRTTRNRQAAKERTDKKKALWADIDREREEIRMAEARATSASASAGRAEGTGSATECS